MEVPKIGSTIQIKSVKHNQKLHRSWWENVVLHSDNQIVIGANNNTVVEDATGKRWRTTEPAIFYFDRRYWFNIIKIFGEKSYYYCNLSSPFTYENNILQYIDYDIDIIVQTNWCYKIVDQDEYEWNKRKFKYPNHIQRAIKMNLIILQDWIKRNQDPFNHHFINDWFQKYSDKNLY